MIASQYDRPDIVNLLLQAGADKDAQNAVRFFLNTFMITRKCYPRCE
jgi:ABC-type transporter lipoprotein component MlaA